MPKYAVRKGEQVKRNGRVYPEGKVLELTPAEAEAMPWAIEPVGKVKDTDPVEKTEPKKTTTKKK